jgi:hypothetical protein
MIGIPRDAPGSVACGRSGLPLLAICPIWHNRLVAFRLLKTSETDRTSLYGRPFKCRACGSREVTLFAIESNQDTAYPIASRPMTAIASRQTLVLQSLPRSLCRCSSSRNSLSSGWL